VFAEDDARTDALWDLLRVMPQPVRFGDIAGTAGLHCQCRTVEAAHGHHDPVRRNQR
jgi:hypothetical protein